MQGFHPLGFSGMAKKRRAVFDSSNRVQVLWLDLWNVDFNEGLRVQIEDLTAGPVGCR